jgi:hypothetical protein
MSIAKGYTNGYIGWTALDSAALETGIPLDDINPTKLFVVNGNQKAYQVSTLTGFM